MADVSITTGTGANVATDSATRDGVTENVQLFREENSLLRTYFASNTATAFAGSGAIFLLTGSSTSIVRLRRVMVSGIASTAVNQDFSIVKYSSTASGGTLITTTKYMFDSSNGASSAGALFYTATPTLGTVAGIVYVRKMLLTNVTTYAAQPIDISFGMENEQCPVLRSNNEQYGIVFGAAIAGGSIDVSVWWTEELTAASF